MTAPETSRLLDLIKQWRAREAKFEQESNRRSKGRQHLEANRYEGIGTGTRWCIEDLEKLIKTNL